MTQLHKQDMQGRLDEILHQLHPKHKTGECLRMTAAKSALNAYYKSILLEVLDEEIPSLFEGLENRIKERLESRLGE